MQFKTLAAAALLAVAGSQAFASTPAEYFDAGSSTYVFGAIDIAAGEPSFEFVASTADGIAAGTYAIVGDISASNYAFTSITLNGTSFDLYPDNKGKIRFGSIEVTEALDLTLLISGAQFGAKNGNFQGSLILTAVPEPETYALMLAGLGAVGFIARRRKLG